MKESFLICSDLKIVHLTILCRVLLIDTRVVDAILPIMVRQKLGLMNI